MTFQRMIFGCEIILGDIKYLDLNPQLFNDARGDDATTGT